MQSKFMNRTKFRLSELSTQQQILSPQPNSSSEPQPFLFQAYFKGCMDMYSEADIVASYLNAHEGWFCRCAQPMKVEPLGENGYILTVGCFSSFGYEVEPKMAVVLNPQIDRVYTMQTIPIPDYEALGYQINYQAVMKLKEVPKEALAKSKSVVEPRLVVSLPAKVTQVAWKLNLAVEVTFPNFIYKLPSSLIQKTGDRLLGQIVRQVSPRLTYKVQQDFHSTLKLPIPPKSGRSLERVSQSQFDAV